MLGDAAALGERSKTRELLKLKDWRSELCSDVGGTNLSSPGHEAWASLTRLPQYMKHKRGCLHRWRTEPKSLPLEPHCPLSAAECRQDVHRQPRYACVKCYCTVSAACGTFSCSWAAGSSTAAGPAGGPGLCPSGEGEVSNSWLTELMSVPASLCSCPPHSAGEGRVEGRYQLYCWGMQFPGTRQAQIISAFSFNDETMSRDSSGKPNLA